MNDKVICLVGEQADEEIAKALSALGFAVEPLPVDARLAHPIRSHADTLLFSYGMDVFASEEYIKTASSVFDRLSSYGYMIHSSAAQVSAEYPKDIAFNAFVCRGRLFGRLAHTAPEICRYAAEIGLSAQTVKQGYAKCSTLVLGDKAIITADSGIAHGATMCGIEVLKTEDSPEAIALKGYDYGFIGGACGVFDSTVYFTGDISAHPQGDEICDFCKRFGYRVKSLSAKKLTDIGGIMFFPRCNA